MLVVEDSTVIVKCKTAAKALFNNLLKYYVQSNLSYVTFDRNTEIGSHYTGGR